MFGAHLTRIVAKTGGTLREVSAYQTKLSQYCHQCGRYVNPSASASKSCLHCPARSTQGRWGLRSPRSLLSG
jgi:hypothetical protein